jgi:hypothetical protein
MSPCCQWLVTNHEKRDRCVHDVQVFSERSREPRCAGGLVDIAHIGEPDRREGLDDRLDQLVSSAGDEFVKEAEGAAFVSICSSSSRTFARVVSSSVTISLLSAATPGRSYSGRRVQRLPSACGYSLGKRSGRTRSTSSTINSLRRSTRGRIKIIPASGCS